LRKAKRGVQIVDALHQVHDAVGIVPTVATLVGTTDVKISLDYGRVYKRLVESDNSSAINCP